MSALPSRSPLTTATYPHEASAAEETCRARRTSRPEPSRKERLGSLEVDGGRRAEPEHPLRVGADRLTSRGAQPFHSLLVPRDGQHPQAPETESPLGAARSPPRGVALELRSHPRDRHSSHVDLDEERRRAGRCRKHGERIGDKRDPLDTAAAQEVNRVGERVARRLPSEQAHRALGIEQAQHNGQVVLEDLMVDEGDRSGARYRNALAPRELSEEQRASTGERVRRDTGGASKRSELAITREARDDLRHCLQ